MTSTQKIASWIFAALLIVASATGMDRPANAAELVMFEEAGCSWCAVWDEEIAPIYPKTPEGKIAPLRRVDLHGSRPEDLRKLKGIRYTPTFVLVVGGQEIGRIQGYPGEDFFWGLLGKLIAQLAPASAAETASGGGQ